MGINNMNDELKVYSEINVRDGRIEGILDQLILNFNSSVETVNGIWFNQYKLIVMIESYKLSQYTENNDPNAQFLNTINQALNTANRKVRISPNEINLSIDDKPFDYLLKAGHAEYNDDMFMEDFYRDLCVSANTYGTAVEKSVKKTGKKNIKKIVPFHQIIWDQNDAENHPMGEVFMISLSDLMERGQSMGFEQDKLNKVYESVLQQAGEYLDAKNSKIALYEIHGMMPEKLFTLNDNDTKLVQGMFVVVENQWGTKHVLYAGREDKHPYRIYRRQIVPNRSMGLGIVEELIPTQKTTNELYNLAVEQLRATSKVVYQTSDTELDGQDLQEIDNLTLISHEEGSPITQ